MTQFSKDTSIADRVEATAPKVNSMIEEKGDDDEGVECFQKELLQLIEEAGLLERDVWYNTDHVAVHPDNREKAMLVPVDVHDLALALVHKGWNYARWEALACEKPQGALGEEWLDALKTLTDGADGLLATYNRDLVKIFTGRGSHGTAAVRCMKSGSKGIHGDLCVDGHVSQSKICERMPSLREPIDKGCPYTIIKAELVVACPRLMEVLSRSGNATHDMFRSQTALQHCKRIHSLMKDSTQTKGLTPEKTR